MKGYAETGVMIDPDRIKGTWIDVDHSVCDEASYCKKGNDALKDKPIWIVRAWYEGEDPYDAQAITHPRTFSETQELARDLMGAKWGHV